MESSTLGVHAPDSPVTESAPDGPAANGHGDLAEREWAICCSGGGIRSAAYCLGALQSLDRIGLLAKVRWILGRIGGQLYRLLARLWRDNLRAGTQPHAYAPGTAEERNLRYNTRYIAPNGRPCWSASCRCSSGRSCTFVIALAPLYALAHAWGWLLRWQDVLVPSGPHAMTAGHRAGLVAVAAIAAGITLIAFGFWWLTLAPGRRAGGRGGCCGRLRPDGRDRGADRRGLVGGAATRHRRPGARHARGPAADLVADPQHRVAGHDHPFPWLRREAILVARGAGRPGRRGRGGRQVRPGPGWPSGQRWPQGQGQQRSPAAGPARAAGWPSTAGTAALAGQRRHRALARSCSRCGGSATAPGRDSPAASCCRSLSRWP